MTPEECPYPVRFVRASVLWERGASDREVRQAVQAVESHE